MEADLVCATASLENAERMIRTKLQEKISEGLDLNIMSRGIDAPFHGCVSLIDLHDEGLLKALPSEFSWFAPVLPKPKETASSLRKRQIRRKGMHRALRKEHGS
jgi:hypothetical protein